ncbi:MAG: fatty acid desaturase, partial [Planctomycetaceae bacterium]
MKRTATKRMGTAKQDRPVATEILPGLPGDDPPSALGLEGGQTLQDQGVDMLCRRSDPPAAVTPGSAGQPLKFSDSNDFLGVLRQRVDDYFHTTGLPQRDCPQMYVKTLVIFCWFTVSYALLVLVATTWWQALPLAVSLGLAMAAIGFNIQHDGGHQAYSNHSWVNRLMALTLDLMGGSSYAWDRKHNSIHHTYANITGHDDDINIGILGRLSPHQKRLKFHRLQHFYLWILYGVMTVKWQVYDDFRDVFRGQIEGHTFTRPKGWSLVLFISGKLVFFSLAFVIPMLLCGVGP